MRFLRFLSLFVMHGFTLRAAAFYSDAPYTSECILRALSDKNMSLVRMFEEAFPYPIFRSRRRFK